MDDSYSNDSALSLSRALSRPHHALNVRFKGQQVIRADEVEFRHEEDEVPECPSDVAQYPPLLERRVMVQIRMRVDVEKPPQRHANGTHELLREWCVAIPRGHHRGAGQERLGSRKKSVHVFRRRNLMRVVAVLIGPDVDVIPASAHQWARFASTDVLHQLRQHCDVLESQARLGRDPLVRTDAGRQLDSRTQRAMFLGLRAGNMQEPKVIEAGALRHDRRLARPGCDHSAELASTTKVAQKLLGVEKRLRAVGERHLRRAHPANSRDMAPSFRHALGVFQLHNVAAQKTHAHEEGQLGIPVEGERQHPALI
mmetsp:Transcript_32320/g.89286  ORF Transcript_32320/g.89286 Transcript_32320/m.89286 type:complete len:312 (-) Transcript_32320:61-996(-)